MTSPPDLDRFKALADAYGGVVARWPERDRAEAERIAATREGSAILARASSLDACLDAWRVPAAASDLAGRIAAGAPSVSVDIGSRLRWWWSGLGLAATLAGAVAGMAAVAVVPPIEAGAGGSTSFGDVAGMDG